MYQIWKLCLRPGLPVRTVWSSLFDVYWSLGPWDMMNRQEVMKLMPSVFACKFEAAACFTEGSDGEVIRAASCPASASAIWLSEPPTVPIHQPFAPESLLPIRGLMVYHKCCQHLVALNMKAFLKVQLWSNSRKCLNIFEPKSNHTVHKFWHESTVVSQFIRLPSFGCQVLGAFHGLNAALLGLGPEDSRARGMGWSVERLGPPPSR